jgi:hypothetical protein
LSACARAAAGAVAPACANAAVSRSTPSAL